MNFGVNFVIFLRFDRNLGSGDFQERLRNHLVELFNKQKKTKSVVTENQRSMAKLMKEAGRVMQVLSANTDHYAQVGMFYYMPSSYFNYVLILIMS